MCAFFLVCGHCKDSVHMHHVRIDVRSKHNLFGILVWLLEVSCTHGLCASDSPVVPSCDLLSLEESCVHLHACVAPFAVDNDHVPGPSAFGKVGTEMLFSE